MRKILITGGSGFIGRNLKEALSGEYDVYAPSHRELDLLDGDALEKYIAEKRIDFLIHGAIHVPMFNGAEHELFNDLTMFANIEKASMRVEKVLYFGSGAEYDKRFDLRNVREEEIGKHIPGSEYGMAKYVMNRIAQGSRNIYNLRLFGIFGKYELWQIKFLSNLCCKAAFDLPLSVRMDCAFDFLYIDDLPDIVRWFLEGAPSYHDYNVCMGRHYQLTELAEMVRDISGKNLPIVLLSEERNKNYTGSCDRLKNELCALHITPMKAALRELYQYYCAHKDDIDFEILKNSR